MSADELPAIATRARAWLFEAALPLWATAGFNPGTGFFVESLDGEGRPSTEPHRVRVQARQTYVFMEAGRLGWPGPWRDLATAGLRTLLGPARAEGGASGFRIDAEGVLVDARRDLYDQAFSLFALAHARALDPVAVDGRIGEILAYLDTQRAPGGGFLEGDIDPWPRRQNPHMHLLEAGLALTAAGAPQGQELLEEVGTLFAKVFYDPHSGSLSEYYADDLMPLPGDRGALVEPGHHCEWAWLLDGVWRRGGPDFTSQADRLWAHALRHGLERGILIDEVLRTGQATASTARLWPQTERLKAALVRWERQAPGAGPAEILAAFEGLFGFLEGAPPGLWHERRFADGRVQDGPSPASSLYHLTCAISELVRAAGGPRPV